MEDFSQLGSVGGGGGGTSSGSFLYLPLATTSSNVTTTTSTGTTSTAPLTPSASAVYGRSYLLPSPSASTGTATVGTSILPYLQSSRFNAEAGSSHRRTVENHREPQGDEEIIKAKIVSHPQYSTLLGAFMDCHKVGASPDAVERLSTVVRKAESHPICGHKGSSDPELDQFMEAYYNMLVKYKEELTRPLQEATNFLKKIESQFNALTNISSTSSRLFSSDDKCEGIGSSEDDPDASGGEAELPEIDPQAEDKELKHHLLRKYSGYLSSLRQELSKKKKKGKLPKEARQKLLNWWELHYKWPYPSETEKVALAQSTGLDQKQINNWFINQRKRHWKPSEDMQFVVMDGFHPHNAAAAAALFVEGQLMGDGLYRIGP